MTRGCKWRHNRKRGLWFEKSQLVNFLSTNSRVEFLPPKKKVDFRSSPKPCGGCCAWWWWWGEADGKVSIEKLYLSPYVENPFNSKVIKSFVPELRSHNCFLCFGIPMLSIYELWTFYVYFTYSCMAVLHNDEKKTAKSAEEDWLQQQETQASTEQK